MKKKKILIILVPGFDPNSGGVQMSTAKLAGYFISQEFDVTIFSFTHEGHVTMPDVKLYHAEQPRVNYNVQNLQKCQSVIELVKPDIVINQMPYEFNVGRLLKDMKARNNFLLLGCLRGSFFAVKQNLETYRKTLLPKPLQPFFKHALGYWILLHIHKLKHGRDLRFIVDTYDRYILFGAPNRVELEYFIGKYKQQKLAYIPNSIPSVVDKLPQKEKRILWLSRVDYRQKHAELIIPLWKLLKDRLPGWEFDVVGSGGALDDLKKQVSDEGIERITLYGKQKPDSYYARSPVYLMTSSFEGFPNTLIEAQSFGAVPVVFDSYPMIKEIVSDSNAIFVKTFDIDSMADEVVRLVNDEDRLTRMMNDSIRNAERYTIDKVGKKWLELFETRI